MSSKNWIWKETAELIGVLGVIGSLIFVAFEIQQNTSATLSTAMQAISDQSVSINLALAQDSELRATFRTSLSEDGLDRLTEDQTVQLGSYYVAILRMHQNRFQLIQLGIVDDEDVYSAGGYGDTYYSPFFKEFWRKVRHRYSDEFVRWFEDQLGFEDGSDP